MLSTYARPVLQTLLRRLDERPARIINIDGPRQCGKTTLIRQALQAIGRPSRYHSFDPPVSETIPQWDSVAAALAKAPVPYGPRPDLRLLLHIWEQARSKAKASGSGFILVLDEVHRIRDWSSVVKGLWDADRHAGLPMHVVVLGSSPMTMRTDMSDALVGRFETIRLAHWSLAEMEEAFGVDLNRFIYFGGYPGAADLVHDEDRWRAYVMDSLIETTLSREVLAFNRIDKPAVMRQLVQVGSSKSGEIVSFTKLLGQLQDAGNTTTIARYLELFSHAGLLIGLGKYSTQLLNTKRSTPKLQVLNAALMSVFSGYTFGEAQSDRTHWGRLVESSVGAHLCNTAASGTKVHYWRHNGAEVDFVISRGSQALGVEVKATTQRRSTKGLEIFKQRYAHADTLVVGTDGLPLGKFFRTSTEDLFRSS